MLKQVGGLLGLLLLGAVLGWAGKSLQIKSRDAELAAARVRDSIRDDSVHREMRARYVADSTDLALRLDTQKALARGQERAAKLASDSAERSVARADVANAKLADAKTAADSLPHVVAEVEQLRVAIGGFRQSNDSLTGAARNWENAYLTDSLARIRDRKEADSTAARLGRQNQRIAEDLAAANRARGFHLTVKLPTAVAVLAGAGATFFVCRETSLCGKHKQSAQASIIRFR